MGAGRGTEESPKGKREVEEKQNSKGKRGVGQGSRKEVRR